MVMDHTLASLEAERDHEEACQQCGNPIRLMVQQGTRVCCQLCENLGEGTWNS
jgi:hypothetical protein